MFEQGIVYVEIIKDSAAEILTARRYVELIANHLTPGKPNSTRFVVVGGDQPSYKTFYEMWLASWRDAKKGTSRCNDRSPALHEWLIPFPGFFHVESRPCMLSVNRCLMALGLRN